MPVSKKGNVWTFGEIKGIGRARCPLPTIGEGFEHRKFLKIVVDYLFSFDTFAHPQFGPLAGAR